MTQAELFDKMEDVMDMFLMEGEAMNFKAITGVYPMGDDVGMDTFIIDFDGKEQLEISVDGNGYLKFTLNPMIEPGSWT